MPLRQRISLDTQRDMASSSNIGRPSLDIDLERVEGMRKTGVSMMKISKTLGISRSTLYRALENSDLIGYTNIRK